MAEVWPLTGRREELARVAALLHGHSGGVVLAGGAGVGKTRLAREALGLAARRGVITHWAAATSSSAAVPLGCFAHLLDDGGRGDPATVLRRSVEAMLRGAGRSGAALGVDDAHLLDDASATLLHQMATTGVLRLVITLRSGEPAPDAVTTLWKDGRIERLEIQPLSMDETVALVEATPRRAGGAGERRPAMADHPGQRALPAADRRRGAGGGQPLVRPDQLLSWCPR